MPYPSREALPSSARPCGELSWCLLFFQHLLVHRTSTAALARSCRPSTIFPRPGRGTRASSESRAACGGGLQGVGTPQGAGQGRGRGRALPQGLRAVSGPSSALPQPGGSAIVGTAVWGAVLVPAIFPAFAGAQNIDGSAGTLVQAVHNFSPAREGHQGLVGEPCRMRRGPARGGDTAGGWPRPWTWEGPPARPESSQRAVQCLTPAGRLCHRRHGRVGSCPGACYFSSICWCTEHRRQRWHARAGRPQFFPGQGGAPGPRRRAVPHAEGACKGWGHRRGLAKAVDVGGPSRKA